MHAARRCLTPLVGILLLVVLRACSDRSGEERIEVAGSGAPHSPSGVFDAGRNLPDAAGTASDASSTRTTTNATDASPTTLDSAPGLEATDAAAPSRAHCKRGVAYGHHSLADMQALSPGVSWWYNWTHVPDEGVRAGAFADLRVEYVPMTWNGSFDVDTLVAEIPAGATHLLGFNEPNFGSQANLTAVEAASLWPNVEAVADARHLRLVSPAVNYCGGDCRDTNPFNYLSDFFDACDGCRVEAIAIHIYVGCDAQWLIDHVENYKAQFDLPLWLTEFACDSASSLEEQRDFMQAAVAYLEGEPRIERYAWFAGRADNVPFVDLLGADGELTLLGDAYVSLPQAPGCEL